MELLQCLQSTLHPGCSQFNDRFSLTDIQQIYSTLEAITRYQPCISLEAVVSSATLFIYIINYERKSFDLWESFKYEIGLYIIYNGLLQQKRLRAKPFLKWMNNWNITIFFRIVQRIYWWQLTIVFYMQPEGIHPQWRTLKLFLML